MWTFTSRLVSLGSGPEVGGPRALGHAWSLECWLDKSGALLTFGMRTCPILVFRPGLFSSHLSSSALRLGYLVAAGVSSTSRAPRKFTRVIGA